jgi:excisionase family DNA binding protein
MTPNDHPSTNGPVPSGDESPKSESFELIQVTEAARLYPIATKRLYRLIHEGAIPAIVIDNPVRKRILVRAQAVEAWLRAQERRQGGTK